ncbi:glycosyltransferase family 4 protein [Acidithiobacillus caldus]|uniref:glycosyltransferase family 4 protein n=1 Tax=Acidithiobacillus caldus TaxID=33059 RepID=UPI000AF547DA|nr:glycosyltransferase family 1 protein [Acidithiobacillus caldus]
MNTPILVDVTRLCARHLEGLHPTGIDRVTLAYLRHYRPRVRAVVRHGGRWLRLSAKGSSDILSAILETGDNGRKRIRSAVARAHLMRASRCEDCWFFNLSHSGLEDTRYGDILKRLGLRPLFFIHDLIPVVYPEYGRPGEEMRHAHRLETIRKSAGARIFNSEATRQSWHHYWAQHGIRASGPELVAPLGCSSLPKASGQRPLADPYFVVLGTIEARKNHLLLLQIWRHWLETARNAEIVPKLVLLGRRGWECEQVLDLLERSHWLRGQVVELGPCADEEIATWLKHAQALLFPSFAEGFGLPLVEALSLGTPVIASDLPAFREAAGNVPDYLSPLDGLGWRQLIQDYLKDGPRRQAQRARMAGFRPWTWSDHFALVDAFLESQAQPGASPSKSAVQHG